jgi:hypothetical protein
MRLYHVLVFLLPGLIFLAGCGEDTKLPEDPVDQIDNGDIYGVVIDVESGIPVEGASVSIGGQVALTDANGKYALQGILFSDNIEVSVTSDDYREYETTISLVQELMLLDISLAPVDSPTDRILGVLESLSQDIAALDPDRIPSIQSYFTEDYIAANDPVEDLATFFGVAAGVVPPDYQSIPDTMLTIVGKYDKLEFKFADPDVELIENAATVLMQFEIYAETKPKPPDIAKKWELVANGQLDLRKEGDGWKITYWRLIPPFLKFEEEPLE